MMMLAAGQVEEAMAMTREAERYAQQLRVPRFLAGMEQRRAMFAIRLGAMFGGFFALLALVLAMVGLYGLVAYGLYRFLSSLDTGWLAWDERGPWLAGVVIVAAGIYESTPLKRR